VRYTANANFTPDSGPGVYQFRARLQTGPPLCSANYSNAVAITVTS
jgi:hypothetical protein